MAGAACTSNYACSAKIQSLFRFSHH